MTATNETTTTYHGHCIVDCGWVENPAADHGPYCERTVGTGTHAVTEPGWDRVQFWCSVISPYLHGTIARTLADGANRYRDGVQLTVNIWDDPVSGDYRDVEFNMTAGEARQLAAQLIAAADSHDGIDRSPYLMRRIEKLAKKVGAEIYGP